MIPIEDLIKELEMFDKQNMFSREQVKIMLERLVPLLEKKIRGSDNQKCTNKGDGK